MKKAFFFILLIFISFSNLTARTITLPKESNVSQERQEIFLKKFPQDKEAFFSKDFDKEGAWDGIGTVICAYCLKKLVDCVCSRNSRCPVCFNKRQYCTC